MKVSLGEFARMVEDADHSSEIIFSANDQPRIEEENCLSLDMSFSEIAVSQWQKSIILKCRSGTLRLNHVHNIDIISTGSGKIYKISCGLLTSRKFIICSTH